MTARKYDNLPQKTIKCHLRPYKAIQGHANSNEDTHSHGREKQHQEHTRPHKVIQGHIRAYKAT